MGVVSSLAEPVASLERAHTACIPANSPCENWDQCRTSCCSGNFLLVGPGYCCPEVLPPMSPCEHGLPTSAEVNTSAGKWTVDAGHAQWQKDMTSCGTKCLGRASCVASCMQGDGWSSGCAGCFGDLAGCTASHCMLKCMGGRTPGCVSCLKAAGCDTAAFCAGFVPPSSASMEAPPEILV